MPPVGPLEPLGKKGRPMGTDRRLAAWPAGFPSGQARPAWRPALRSGS